MWSLCRHVVFFIMIQRGLINWIVIFRHHICHSSFLRQVSSYKSPTCGWYEIWHKCLHFLSFHSAHGQEFELSISEHQDSKKSSIQKCEFPFNGCDPTVLFITDAASYNRRSCQLKQGGPVATPTLAPSPRVDMSRCSISRSHSQGRGVCVLFLSCSCPSDIHPTLMISLPIHSIQSLKQWKRLLWYESFSSLVSVWRDVRR